MRGWPTGVPFYGLAGERQPAAFWLAYMGIRRTWGVLPGQKPNAVDESDISLACENLSAERVGCNSRTSSVTRGARVSAAWAKRRVLEAGARAAAAAEVFDPLWRGDVSHVFALTGGQFGQIEILISCVEAWRTRGIDRVSLWTWAIADYEVLALQELLRAVRGADLGIVIDRSCVKRQPELLLEVREKFGDDCVRVLFTHAKIATVRCVDGAVATIRGSANLNMNVRVENIDACTTEEVYAAVLAVEDRLWSNKDVALSWAECNDALAAAIPGARRRILPKTSSARVDVDALSWLEEE